MQTRKAASQETETKLRVALRELKVSKEQCQKLLQEREESEEEVTHILKQNSSLKYQLVQLHQENEMIVEERDKFQAVTVSFTNCSLLYEEALCKIRDLDCELNNAKDHINRLNKEKECSEAAVNQSLYEELVCCGSEPLSLRPTTTTDFRDNSVQKHSKYNLNYLSHNKLKNPGPTARGGVRRSVQVRRAAGVQARSTGAVHTSDTSHTHHTLVLRPAHLSQDSHEHTPFNSSHTLHSHRSTMAAKLVVFLAACIALTQCAMVRRDAPAPNILEEIEKHAKEFQKTFSEQFKALVNSKNTENFNKALKDGSDSVLKQLSTLSTSLQGAINDANGKAKEALEQARQNIEKTAADLRKAHPEVEKEANALKDKLQAAVQSTVQETQKLAKEVASNMEETNKKLAPTIKAAYDDFVKQAEEVQKKLHEAASKQ